VQGLVVEGNLFADSYYEGTKDALDSNQCRGNGLILFRDRDVTIRRNEFRRTCKGLYYKHGEAAAGAGGFTHIYRNAFQSLGSGDGVWSNQNRSEIRRNVLVGASVALHNEDGTQADFTLDALIDRNTIVQGSLSLPMQHSANGRFSGPRRTTIVGNVLFDSGYHVWTYGTDELFRDGVELVSDHNCYFVSNGPQRLDYFGSDNPAYGGSTTGGIYTLAQFQALGFDLHSVEADPQFRDRAGGDYRLPPGSPCSGLGALP